MLSRQSRTSPATPMLADILQPEANSFGLLRLIAALAVVVSHSVHLVGAPESAEPLVSLTGYSLGEHAVHVFFTISGVLIAASLTRSESPWDYLRARALRLLPGLAACVLVTALVAGPLLTELPMLHYFGDAGVLRYIGLTLGLVTANAPLPGVFTHNPVPNIVNLPLWTLKYESLCYLGLVLLGISGWMRSRSLATAALVSVMAIWVAACTFPDQIHLSSSLFSFVRLAFSFGLGTLAYVWRDRLPIHWWGAAGAWLCMAIALGTRWQGPVEQVFVAYTVLWAASLPTGWFGAATRSNDLSYGVYIYDWVIAQALVHLMPAISQPLLLAATLAVLLPVAALSWFLIEKPALGWKRQRAATLADGGTRIHLALRTEPDAAVTQPPANPAAEAAVVPVFPAEGLARDRLARIAGPRFLPELVPAGL